VIRSAIPDRPRPGRSQRGINHPAASPLSGSVRIELNVVEAAITWAVEEEEAIVLGHDGLVHESVPFVSAGGGFGLDLLSVFSDTPVFRDRFELTE